MTENRNHLGQDEKVVIGKEDRLPWHLPAELHHFKETTWEPRHS